MKKLLVLISALFLVLGTFGLASAASIDLNPVDSFATLGVDFNVLIEGSFFDIGTNGSLSGGSAGGGLNVAWDPAILFLNPVTDTFPGDSFFGDLGTIDNGAGTLTGFSVSSLAGAATTSFPIATLNFTPVGLTGLVPSDIFLSLAVGDAWPDFDGLTDMTPAFNNGTIQVNAVPIPGAVLLLGSGLIGLVGLRRKLS